MHYSYGYGVGQAVDPFAQREHDLNEQATSEFREETGLSRPETFEMQIVWLTFKYAAINRYLLAERSFSRPPDAPPGPSEDSQMARWLAEYLERFKRVFAQNPTWDRIARDAMQRIMSQRNTRSGQAPTLPSAPPARAFDLNDPAVALVYLQSKFTLLLGLLIEAGVITREQEYGLHQGATAAANTHLRNVVPGQFRPPPPAVGYWH